MDRHLPFRRPCSSYYASSAKLPIISSARFVIVLICQFVDPLALSSNRIGQSRCDSQPVRRYVQNSRRHGLVFMLRRLRSNHSFCQSFVSRVSHQPRNRPSLFLELPPSTVADSMRPFQQHKLIQCQRARLLVMIIMIFCVCCIFYCVRFYCMLVSCCLLA